MLKVDSKDYFIDQKVMSIVKSFIIWMELDLTQIIFFYCYEFSELKLTDKKYEVIRDDPNWLTVYPKRKRCKITG